MIWTLAIRHLTARPGRAALLLGGYALGVAVMIVLLAVGDAMLTQSKDAALVGGGDVLAIPEGVNLEALRTGGMSGMFFGIDRARFVTRQMLGGPRHEALVRAVSPVLEEKRLTLRTRDTTFTVRAGGEVPSAVEVVGVHRTIIAGAWQDSDADRRWVAPSRGELFDELDRFHLPPGRDTTWAEWHYFNVVASEDEWFYITLAIGGDVRGERWGGQVLVTHRTPEGRHARHETIVERDAVRFDTTRADLDIGTSTVRQADGRYRVRGSSTGVSFDLEVVPAPMGWFPPIELRDDAFLSGYVVPGVMATASGTVCAARRCQTLRDVPAYHDHNWGVWRNVTWEWGTGRGTTQALLYGGVRGGSSNDGSAPFFLAWLDANGVAQVYRFSAVERLGRRAIPDMPGWLAPDSLRIVAVRAGDTLRVTATVQDVAASTSATAGADRRFLQMRARWRAVGTAAGRAVADSGMGFFETWLERE
jgi:hypothetical protein